MRSVDLLAALALAATIPVLALAQPSGAPTHSTIHERLARQLYALSGGESALKQRLDAMSDAASKVIAARVPADQAPFVAALQDDAKEALAKLAPLLDAAGVRSYVDSLTTEELQADIAQLSSDASQPLPEQLQSRRDQVAELQRQSLSLMLPKVRTEVSYRVCAQMGCSNGQRAMVASVLAKALSS